MVVYLDLVMIIDFCITFIFLFVINKLLHNRIRYLRLFIASLLSTMLILSYLLNYTIYLIIKIIGGIVIVYISNKVVKIKEFIVNVVLYYLLNFSFIGILSSFKIKEFVLTIIVLIITILFINLETRKKEIIIKNKNAYDLMIFTKNNALKVSGFMDSGNDSTYKNKPIIYLSKRYENNDLILIGQTIVTTIGGVSLHKVYKAKKVVLDNKEIECYFVFVEMIDNECILNILLV